MINVCAYFYYITWRHVPDYLCINVPCWNISLFLLNAGCYSCHMLIIAVNVNSYWLIFVYNTLAKCHCHRAVCILCQRSFFFYLCGSLPTDTRLLYCGLCYFTKTLHWTCHTFALHIFQLNKSCLILSSRWRSTESSRNWSRLASKSFPPSTVSNAFLWSMDTLRPKQNGRHFALVLIMARRQIAKSCFPVKMCYLNVCPLIYWPPSSRNTHTQEKWPHTDTVSNGFSFRKYLNFKWNFMFSRICHERYVSISMELTPKWQQAII